MANGTEVNWEDKKKRLVDILEPVLIAYLYVTAVLQPYIGLVLGIVLMTKADLEQNRRLGKNCVIISAIFLAVGLLCCVAYFVLIIFGSLAGSMPTYY